MPFETTCPHCGRLHEAMPDGVSGAMVRCRGCFKPFTALALAPVDGGPPTRDPGEDRAAEAAAERPAPDGGGELRAVVARLADIRRRCGALVERHPDLAELEPALDTVLRGLRLGHGPRGEPLSVGELALPLGPWARRLHRLGLPVLGRELGHVERALIAADAARAREGRADAGAGERRPAAAGSRTGTAARAAEAALPPQGRRRPAALTAAGAVVVVVAVLAAVVVIRRSADPARPTGVVREPPATPAGPSPTPAPSAPAVAETLAPSPRDLSRLVEAASQAQLAAQRGELDLALDHLEASARVDPTRAEVRAAAQAVVDEMMGLAGRDESEGRFQEAEERLLGAQRLSGRFRLDTTALDAHLRRLRSAERTVRLLPAERERLAGAIGRRVEVRMAGREVREGTLNAVDGEALVLEVHERVGMGEVAYTLRVPLAKVDLVVYRYRP